MIKILPKSIALREGYVQFVEQEFKGEDELLFNDKTLKKDLVIYLIYYAFQLSKKYEENGNVFPISTEILKSNFLANYKPYMDFLEKKMVLIIVHEYDTFAKRSRLYSLTDKYYKVSKKFVSYIITDKPLLQKISYRNTGLNKYQLDRNKECFKLRKHLVKNFDEHLTMDVLAARKEISDFSLLKYDINSLTIFHYENKHWTYSIDPESDNRLHSILTRTNNKLLKFIKYNNQKLGDIDIKSSQPLFLYAILKAIFIDTNSNTVLYKFIKDTLEPQLLDKIILKGIDLDELRDFGKLIVEEDLYNSLVDRIAIKTDKKGRAYRIEGETKNVISFDTKRDFMKEIVMRCLYRGRGPYVTKVREQFKSVFDIVDIINESKDRSEVKCYLSKILQHVEAYIFLDKIALDIHKKFKDIPLFSKHDSIITYADSIDDVKPLVKSKFKEYTGIDGNILKISRW